MKTPKLPLRPRTKADWRAWLRHDLDFCEEMLVATGVLRPMFILHKPDGTLILLQVDQLHPEHKENVYRFMTLAAVAHEVAAISALFEAWTLSVDIAPGESPEQRRRRAETEVLPSQSERRQEIITATMVYRDGAGMRQNLGGVREIVRDASGKATGTQKLHQDGDDISEGGTGPLAKLLTEEPPTPTMIATSQEMLTSIGPQLMQALGIHEFRPRKPD